MFSAGPGTADSTRPKTYPTFGEDPRLTAHVGRRTPPRANPHLCPQMSEDAPGEVAELRGWLRPATVRG